MPSCIVQMLHTIRERVVFGWVDECGYDAMFGRHLLESIVHAPQYFSTRVIFTDAANHEMFLSIKAATANGFGSRVGMFIPIYSTRRNDTANFAVHIWRIQRAVRNHLRRKYEARALAVCMGWHERLGKHSCFADIQEELNNSSFSKAE
jgi:hypothetical protein